MVQVTLESSFDPLFRYPLCRDVGAPFGNVTTVLILDWSSAPKVPRGVAGKSNFELSDRRINYQSGNRQET